MASYEAFDGLVRQCVLWLGFADPLESQKIKGANGAAGKFALFTELFERAGQLDKPFTAQVFTGITLI